MDTLITKLTTSLLLIPTILGNLLFPGLALKQELADVKLKLLEAREQLVGSTFQTPEARALFETSLSSKISSTATSFTLTSATDKDSNTLASSTYGFIIDEGTADEELILADCTGTTCTNATRGLSVNTGTTTVSALRKPHRAGANVKMTDAPLLLFVKNALKGKQNFESIMSYDSSITDGSFTAGSNQLASVAYADALSFAGAPNASESAKGISELATASEASIGATSGSTGARLVLPASIATSTYQAGSSNKVVITDSNNKIDNDFIATSTTDSYSFAGAVSFSTSTTTLNATTSISATINTAPLLLNGVDYAFPSTEGASSTILKTNGSGTLSWDFPKATSTVFTASGTWVRPSGVNWVKVRVQGGGGAGGGGSTTGGGGGAGGYAEAIVNVTGNVTVTVGAAGTGASDSAGGNGGDSIFAGVTTITGAGGTGGATSGAGGAGGGTTNALFGVTGQNGKASVGDSQPGTGGNSILGFGGFADGDNINGNAGEGKGAGGSGADGASRTGGNGSAGVVIVEWLE